LEETFSEAHARELLRLARKVITETVGQIYEGSPPDLSSDAFKVKSATFVTLEKKGVLRGCIGTLVSSDTIETNIAENAVSAALHDYRFRPVTPDELSEIKIEISILTPPKSLEFKNESDLLAKIRPGIDGVILSRGRFRATFLPQVWDQLQTRELFLSHLCLKAGLPEDDWQRPGIEIQLYQVQHFSEK
jgi:AmmeMemoRadiSam system protein A